MATSPPLTNSEETEDDFENDKSDDDNGLVLCGMYLPEELIGNILCRVDYKSLLECQLVCKQWKMLMESYVWRKKAEMTVGYSLQSIRNAKWDVFYCICNGAFERNLLKNNSGQEGLKKWKDIRFQGDGWVVECPPQGVLPFPCKDPLQAQKQHCFVTSYYTCSKTQSIDLVSEGLTAHVLDTFQPRIVVSEWFSCRWDCPGLYECYVELLSASSKVIDRFEFVVSIEGGSQNQWHRMSHEFTNYGPGVRKVNFHHGGTDYLVWAGNYGSKMAEASVRAKIFDEPDPPLKMPEDYIEPDRLKLDVGLLDRYRTTRARNNVRRWDRQNRPLY